MTQVNADNALAIYRVGPVLCCGPTRNVVAIIEPPQKLTQPPGSTAAEPGIFAFNRQIVSATDLRYRFGVPETNWKHPGRVIITELEEGARGYWVDDIVDVVEMPTNGWQALPAGLPRGVFKSTLLIKDKILLYAEFDKLATLQGEGYLKEYIEELYSQHSATIQAKVSSLNSQKTVHNESSANTPTVSSDANSQTRVTTAESTVHVSQDSTTTKNTNVTKLHSADSSRPSAVTSSNATLENAASPNARTPDSNAVNNTAGNHSTGTNSTANNVLPFKSPGSQKVKSTQNLSLKSSQKNDAATVKKTDSLPAQTQETHPTSSQHVRQNSRSESNSPGPSRFNSTDTGTNNQTVDNTNKSSQIHNRRRTDNINNADKSAGTYPTENKATIKSASNIDNKIFEPSEKSLHTTNKTDINKSSSYSQEHSSHLKTPAPASSSVSNTSYNEDFDQGSGWFGIVIILVLVVLFMGGGYYYFAMPSNTPLSDNVAKTYTPKPIVLPDTKLPAVKETLDNKDEPQISMNPASEVLTPEETTKNDISKTDTDITSENNTETTDGTSDNEVQEPAITSMTNTETETSKPDSKDNTSETQAYQAYIEKNDNGVTIVLTSPIKPEFATAENRTTRDSQTTQPDDVSSTTTADEDKAATIFTKNASPTSKALTTQSSSKPERVQYEITHVVVKGDTLWHIAIRYLNNPYRYPELARLSKIKNPDLIYPGNIVRIIYRSE